MQTLALVQQQLSIKEKLLGLGLRNNQKSSQLQDSPNPANKALLFRT